jgi:hypothetical protein
MRASDHTSTLSSTSEEPLLTSPVDGSDAPDSQSQPPIDETEAAGQASYTYNRMDGNRYVSGSANLLESEPVLIQLNGTPLWLAAAAYQDGTVWAAALENGEIQVFIVSPEGVSSPYPLSTSALLPGMPPALVLGAEGAEILVPPEGGAPFSHPILTAKGVQVGLMADGSLLWGSQRLPVNALPDARLVSDEQGRVLLLAGPTSEYDHGVLGDAVEATQVMLVNVEGGLKTVLTTEAGTYIEGIMPLWADLNGDGMREVILTLASYRQGAWLAAYNEDGTLVGSSTAIGQGYRWRHKIAVSPFGPNSEVELVDVRTPHLGRVIEFFQLKGDELMLTASYQGYTSHAIGSRNLDMAMAADVDGNSRPELVLPNPEMTALGVIGRTELGTDLRGEFALKGRLTTNLAGVSLPDGILALGAGTDAGLLMLWLP